MKIINTGDDDVCSNLIRAVCFYAILFTSFFSVSQLSEGTLIQEFIKVRQFNVEHGLNQSMVTCVYEDKEGILWIGTGLGMNYFDGHEIKRVHFTNNQSPENSIVRSIHPLCDRKFLVTTTKEIGVFDKNYFSFHSIYQSFRSEPIPLLSIGRFWKMFWSVDHGFFVLCYNPLCPILFPLENLNKLINEEPKLIKLSTQKELLISTTASLYAYSLDGDTMHILDAQYYTNIEKLKKKELLFIQDENLFLWRNSTLLDWSKFGFKSSRDFGDTSYYMHFPKKSSVVRFSNNQTSELKFLVSYDKFMDTLSSVVKFVHDDKKGNVFIGTDGDGLLYFDTKKVDFEVARIGFTNSICSTKNFLWVVTNKQGLWRMTHDLKNKESIQLKGVKLESHILTMTQKSSEILLASTSNQIFAFNEMGEVLSCYQFEGDENFTKSKIFVLDTNTLVLQVIRSENYEDCMDYYFDLTNKRFDLIKEERKNDFIIQLLKLNDILVILNYKSLSFSKDPFSNDVQEIGQGKYYSGVFRGEYLYASSNLGIQKFRYSSPDKFMEITDFKAKTKSSKYGLLIDDVQNIWFSSNAGIGLINEKDEFQFFDNSFDYQSLEFCASAFHRNKQWIYFGGVNGVNAINSALFTESSKAKNDVKLSLSSIKINDQAIELPNTEVTHDISQFNTKVSGQISTNDLSYNESQRFSFYLENYNEDWTEESKSSQFEYQKLAPGEYNLWVKSKNAFGVWSNPICLLRLNVPKTFYQEWWFRILFLGTVVFLVIKLVKIIQKRKYERVIEQMNRAHAVDQERLRIARDVHDELGGGLSKLLMISQLVETKINQPEKIDVLNKSIQETSRSMLKNLSDVVWSLKVEQISITMFKNKIMEICNELLENTEINYAINDNFVDENDYSCGKELVKQIIPTIKEILTNIIKHSKSKKVIIDIKIELGVMLLTIEDFGQGFIQGNSQGNGLGNIKQRVESCGGNLQIESTVGSGTKVSIQNLRLDKN